MNFISVVYLFTLFFFIILYNPANAAILLPCYLTLGIESETKFDNLKTVDRIHNFYVPYFKKTCRSD